MQLETCSTLISYIFCAHLSGLNFAQVLLHEAWPE